MISKASATKGNLPDDAYEWHTKPPRRGFMKCPICGLAYNRTGLHRAVRPTEGRHALFLLAATKQLPEREVTDRNYAAPIRSAIDELDPTSLYSFLHYEFFREHFKGKSPDTERTYSTAAEWFSQSLGRSAMVSDLTPDNLAAFWTWGRSKLAQSTARHALQRLRTLWRAACKAGHIAEKPPDPWWWKSGLAPNTGKTLGEYLPIYTLEKGLQKNSAYLLGYSLSRFERALGRPAKWTDLKDTVVNQWLANELEGHAIESVRTMRSGILALWNAAYAARIINHSPTRIRKIKRRAARPTCWTMADLDQLLKTCGRLNGKMMRSKTVDRSDFWKCWVLLGYYSGLRLSDLFAIRWADISTDGVLCVVQNKTGDLITCRLPTDALAALSLIHGEGRERVFGDLIGKHNLQAFFKRIVRAAGLQGSSKWLRKSGASHVEAATTGSARDFLGHRSGIALAYAHYVDPTIAQRLKPMPPRIEGPK